MKNYFQSHYFSESRSSLLPSNIAISSAITSYGRIYLSEYLLGDYQLYYSDTDSIIIDKPLNPEKVGLNLGQMRLKYEIQEGYFLSSKIYGLKTKNNKEIIKSSGIPPNLLTFQDFIEIYQGEKKK
jgi:hypothetical protein